jgi:DNA replication protein DnaC
MITLGATAWQSATGARRCRAAADKQEAGASIKYQLTIAKLPLTKDIDDFQFDGTPTNETLVRDLAGGGFLTQQRNAVLVRKTHLAIAIAHHPL